MKNKTKKSLKKGDLVIIKTPGRYHNKFAIVITDSKIIKQHFRLINGVFEEERCSVMTDQEVLKNISVRWVDYINTKQ